MQSVASSRVRESTRIAAPYDANAREHQHTAAETWKIGRSRYVTYTESLPLLKDLLSIPGVEMRATYSRRGREFGWDVMYPERSLRGVKTALRRFRSEAADRCPSCAHQQGPLDAPLLR